MIRPVSPQQMQRVGQHQLQLPTLLPSTSPLKHSTPPKSPIKKHLQNAKALASETSSSSLHGPLKAKLRASVLQAVLQLLDQDVNALAGAHEVLQAVAALPLAESNVQRACVQALRELQDSNLMPPSFVYDSSSASNAKWDASETPVSPPSPRKETMKAAGRAKSLTKSSLHHCKEFLLACANEIHELDGKHPLVFDYAEDTASLSSLAQPKSLSDKMCKHCGSANFDYASTVQESSVASAESDGGSDDEDDTRADQGSQLSEVLYRAEYMSEADDEVEPAETPMSMRDRGACRQVLRALHENVQSQRQSLRRSNAPNLAAKFRVFEALKLQASITRKRLAFQSLKRGLQTRSQQRPTASNAVIKPRSSPLTSTRFQSLLLHHSDVLLLLMALVILANLPAKYIM